MNIGLFTDSYYPEINGVANSVYMLKTELEKRGHNVYVFTTTTPGAPEKEHNVFRVPSLPCLLITERRVGMFYVPKIASIIKKLNLDLIHTHTEFSLGIFGRIMAKELKLPVVHTYHTIYEDYTHYLTKIKQLDRRAKAFARVFTKTYCNKVGHVIVPTKKVKELLTTYSVYRDIVVVPTGIQLKKFYPRTYQKQEIDILRDKYQLTDEDDVIIYIGRISKEKNIVEIINAMPEYMNKRPSIKFVIVGNGPEKSALVKRVAELKLNERVIFTGEQPWDEIGKFYQLGKVFVSASQSETQGLTYIEAMAAGLAVVAKKDRCLDEILEDGFNGFAFEDSIQLQNGLDQIFFEQKSIPFGENAMKKVERYSTEEFAKSIEQVYAKEMKRAGV